MDAAFVQEGKDILSALVADQAETAAAKKAREAATRAVRETEGRLGGLLRRLERADETQAMESPEGSRSFVMEIIRAETARVEADRQARLAARAEGDTGPDDDDEN